MPENETVAQKLLRAMDAAIDDGNYEAVGRLAVTFHEMVPKDAWARLGLTDAEAEVAEPTAQEPEGEVWWRVRNNLNNIGAFLPDPPPKHIIWKYVDRVRITPIKESEE